MARRAWGSGSLYRRKSDGRWIGSVVDPEGGRRYVTGIDRSLVLRKLRDLGASTSSRRSGETVALFLGRWLDETAPKSVRPRTLAAYRSLATHHIVPAVGRIRLRDLTALDVGRMVDGVLAKGLSPQTALHAHMTLRRALRDALRWRMVDENAAAGISSLRVPSTPVRRLTQAEAVAFLSASRGHPHWSIWVLALTTGMRRGEILSLRWQDVDLRRKTVRIEQTLRRVSRTKWQEEEPKTARSRRTLPLSQLAVLALTEQKARATSLTFVFARTNGRPLEPSWVTVTFQRALEAHGLPKIPFHALRHTAAALMLDESHGDLRGVMDMFGHSTITTTVNRYGGIAEAAKQLAAEGMDRTFADVKTDRAAE